jgi:predicted Zn finger-like uncharacterized protein
MIVICEDCGKKYRIDHTKIKGNIAKFKCKACNHIITVSKPKPETQEKKSSEPFIEAEGEVREKRATSVDTHAEKKSPEKSRRTSTSPRSGGMGLRTKMFILFFALPILFLAFSSLLLMRQMENLASLLTDESTRIVNKMAEEKMADISRSVAMQCKLYLLSHSGLRKQKFSKDVNFKRLAVQKVGLSGYTALYQRPGSDGIWRTWSHVNPKIIGIDMRKIRKTLGKQNFEGFWRIYTDVKGGKESKGYYTWKDKDGRFRNKFMVCTPIDGTPYVIAATTYLDEFTRPVNVLKAQSVKSTQQTRTIFWIILGTTIFLIGIIVAIYGYRLTSRLKSLTDVTERISIGELDANIPSQSKDEIGELAEAISRMQDSIRLSIARLRRRR